jgi:hypothetical protein
MGVFPLLAGEVRISTRAKTTVEREFYVLCRPVCHVAARAFVAMIFMLSGLDVIGRSLAAHELSGVGSRTTTVEMLTLPC